MRNAVAALIGVAALVSCTTVDGTGTTVSPVALPSDLAMNGSSPIATPAMLNEPVVIPVQDPQLAMIEGSISMEGYPTGTLPATLYLGDPSGSNPLGAYVALDIKTAPRGYLQPDGAFVFPNVPARMYSLVLWTPNSAYIVPDPSTGNTWLIEIIDAERLDLGHIQVPALSVTH